LGPRFVQKHHGLKGVKGSTLLYLTREEAAKGILLADAVVCLWMKTRQSTTGVLQT